MKIAIAADHAGYEEKERLKPLLNELGIQCEDLGTVSEESVELLRQLNEKWWIQVEVQL
jgi:ribose 5-phosphate isomerase B